MGVLRSYSFTHGYVSDDHEEADDRWREVFFELLKLANTDQEFRARVEASGAVISNFEAVLASNRVPHVLPSGTIACHEYWWGFQLEIPHLILTGWARSGIDSDAITAAIGIGIGPSAPFRRRAANWIVGHVLELQQIDAGAGVYANMTWMAPNIFIPIAIPRT
jgi:hypothetical protein